MKPQNSSSDGEKNLCFFFMSHEMS